MAKRKSGSDKGAPPASGKSEKTDKGGSKPGEDREAGEDTEEVSFELAERGAVPVGVDDDGSPWDDTTTSQGLPDDDDTQAGAAGVAGVEGPDAEVIDLDRARAEAESAAGANDDNLAVGADAGEAGGDDQPGAVPFEQLEPLIESLLFAADRPLSLADLKRLTGERDSRLLGQAIEALVARKADTGVIVVSVGGGYCLRTRPAFASWVGKLLAAKPVRMSRAMLETLAIIAYRQPITRPEMDEIRGVDCGPVLKTLLDRGLIRIIGKKEEVGRPILYGTTPEFLRIFSLKDLTELPTLRQFHELSAEHQAKVADELGEELPSARSEGGVPGAPILEDVTTQIVSTASVLLDLPQEDRLLADLEEASELAARAARPLNPQQEKPPEGAAAGGPGGREGTLPPGGSE